MLNINWNDIIQALAEVAHVASLLQAHQ